MKIDATLGAVFGAVIAALSVLGGSLIAQQSALRVADRQARTEMVLELMRTSNRQETLDKLGVLVASGLLSDDDGSLIQAISKAPPRAFHSPIMIACGDAADIPQERPPLGSLPDSAAAALPLVYARALELKADNLIMRAWLTECVKSLPTVEDVRALSDQAQTSLEQASEPPTPKD